MAIELASRTVVQKPWGRVDPHPWTERRADGETIGEIWFGRESASAPASSLLLKLLFTAEPLSIQVHPDDDQARSGGELHGKSEAWYVVSSEPQAKIAVGLARPLSGAQLRMSIEDGSIAEQVDWRPAVAGDAVFVPAGTIHAIGAGFVIAEIQQRSDTTFRLYDHGRQRPIHADQAVAVARTEPSDPQPSPTRLTDARVLLVTCSHFILERIDLPAHSNWQLDAEHETWLLVLQGRGRFGALDAGLGQAVFMEASRTTISTGAESLTLLIAYVGPDPASSLLHNLDGRKPGSPLPDLSRRPAMSIATAGLTTPIQETRT
jgi:mannose-6-phosphate isomerase